MLLCGAIGLVLFRAAGLLLDGDGGLPAIIFRGLPLTLLPAATPDLGIFRLTTGLVVRFNLGLLPGLLAGWALHQRFFTPKRRKKKTKARLSRARTG